MRICLVSDTWTPDINGVAHTLDRLCDQLRPQGHALQLIRPQPADDDHRAEGMAAELRVRAAAVPGYRQVRLGLPARRRIRRFWQADRPDVIYLATEGPLGWSALAAAESLGIPVVSGWHTNFDHYCRDYGLGWLRPLVIRRLRHFHNRCATTLVPTHLQARELGQRGFERIRVMARGIDGERFAPEHRDATLREHWGADPQEPVALYVGRLAPEKNLDLLRDTFAAMQDAHPRLTLVVVGDGPGRVNLERALPEAHFAGFVSPDDLSRYYASADIFVFPSISETWGNVLVEAMASGLATIAFRHAAGAALIEDDINGLQLVVGDEDGFRNAAVALCQQPARHARLGRAARRRALTYRWPAIADTFLGALAHAREISDEASRPRHV